MRKVTIAVLGLNLFLSASSQAMWRPKGHQAQEPSNKIQSKVNTEIQADRKKINTGFTRFSRIQRELGLPGGPRDEE